MLGFEFLRYWLTLSMRAWFKKVYLNFEAPLPTDAPIIFACTHPNSAIDYLFAPLLIKKPVYVLVRGDVFEKRILNAFFRSIYMLPVYRFRDGYSSLNKNEQSFKNCYETFDKNGRVLIFSEGVCVQEKNVQPLRKGTARLALDFMHKYGGKKIYVVPLATNYTRYRWFRASVMVNYGKPIDASGYDELYATNANKAYEALTAEIETGLRKRFIEVSDYRDDHPTEKALMAWRMGRSEQRKDWVIEDPSIFDEEKSLVDRLNENEPTEPSKSWIAKATSLDVHPYREGLLTQRLRGDVFLFQLIILAPFMAMAFIPVALPYGLARWLVKNKIKDKIFDNTITIYGTMVFYLIQLLLVLVISTALFGWIGLLIPVTMTLLIMLGIELVDEFIFAMKNWKALSYREAYRQLYNELIAMVGKG